MRRVLFQLAHHIINDAGVGAERTGEVAALERRFRLRSGARDAVPIGRENLLFAHRVAKLVANVGDFLAKRGVRSRGRTNVRAGAPSFIVPNFLRFKKAFASRPKEEPDQRRAQNRRADADRRAETAAKTANRRDKRRDRQSGRRPSRRRQGRLFRLRSLRLFDFALDHLPIRRRFISCDNDGYVIRAAAQIRQVDERFGRFLWLKNFENLSDFGISKLPGKPVAAEQKSVARSQRERALDVDDERIGRPERTGDNVFRDVRQLLKRRVRIGKATRFPNKRMIERQLLDRLVAEPINATVADVPDERAFRKQRERVARRSHIAKRFVAFAAFANFGVRVEERVAERVRGRLIGAFQIRLRNQRRGHLTRQFSGRVRAHTVGDDEERTARLAQSRRRGKRDRERVLIVRAPHSDVGARRNDERVPQPMFVFIVHTTDLKSATRSRQTER